jgi:RND family efflux transporter MFP subunit
MNRFSIKPLTLGLIAAGILVLGGIGLWATRSQVADGSTPATSATGKSGAAKPALTVTTVQARTSVLPLKLAANGSVVAWQEASIGAEVGGLRVQELHANVGDKVKRGQVLASFATEGVQADVALARASLLEANANAAEASANAERARSLQNTGALSAQQISQYLTAEQTAKARVESAKASLDGQLLRLKHTQVLAPDSGILSARTASVGAVVGAGTEMFRLIRQGRLEWRGEVTSAELSRMVVGTGVVLTAPSGAQAKGQVRMVAPTVDAQTRAGLVYVDLVGTIGGKSATNAFKPGMFAKGEFELGTSSALTIPQQSVVVRDGFSYAFRVNPDGRVSQVKLLTGRRVATDAGDLVEVLEGLVPSSVVVASGAGFLNDGDLVKTVAAPAAPKSAPSSVSKVPVAPVEPAQAATK